MHGLVFRTIEAFVRDSHGVDMWQRVTTTAKLDFTRFEAMLAYDDQLFTQILAACEVVLDRPRDVILEDVGTYLVTHPNNAAIRRLMRFGGEDFTELLFSLDDLPGRTRLAVGGLDLPVIELREHALGHFTIRCLGGPPGFGFVLVGLLRAMADDYGTLALLTHKGAKQNVEVIEATVVETGFAEDRGFVLAALDEGAGP